MGFGAQHIQTHTAVHRRTHLGNSGQLSLSIASIGTHPFHDRVLQPIETFMDCQHIGGATFTNLEGNGGRRDTSV